MRFLELFLFINGELFNNCCDMAVEKSLLMIYSVYKFEILGEQAELDSCFGETERELSRQTGITAV